MSIDKTQLAEALLELLTPTKTAKSKSKPKYIITVNGKVITETIPSKKVLETAVRAILIKNPTASISYYKLQGDLAMDLPVAGITTSEEV